MRKWMIENIQGLPEQLRYLLSENVTTDLYQNNFIIALCLVTSGSWVIAFFAYRKKFKGCVVTMMVLISCFLVLNTIQHLSLSIFLQAYTPGVYTAIMFNLPVNYLFLRKLIADSIIGKKQLIVFFLISLPAYLTIGSVALYVFN